MLNALRRVISIRWVIALALASCYTTGCWHDHHDDDWHRDHPDWHDDHHDDHDHDHY
jgi:hypothetical protein